VAKLTGNYSVDVTNTIGNCKTTSSALSIIAQNAPAAPFISANGPLQFCQGDSVELSVTNNAGYAYQWKLNGGAVGSNSNQYIAKSQGTYKLIVSNSNGCSVSSSDSVIITVNSLPAISAVSPSGATEFCYGGNVTLSVPLIAGYSYTWRNEDGPVPNATTNSYLAISTGKYQLDISNASGCVVTTSAVNVNVKPKPDKPIIDSGSYVKGMCLGETPLTLTVSDTVTGYSYQWYKDKVAINNATSYLLKGFLQQGVYTVEANLDGCRSLSDSLPLVFAEAPVKPVITAQGPTVWYLICSIENAPDYKWYYNGTLIQGANKYLYVANQKLGNYNVSIDDNSKKCYTISDTIKIPKGTTGIEDVDPFIGLLIYPNPSSGLFTIELDNQLFGELSISVLDQGGKEIMNIKSEKTTERFERQIDLSGQSKGMYLIIFHIDKYLTNRKVIVK
jgi:hypothetical protein